MLNGCTPHDATDRAHWREDGRTGAREQGGPGGEAAAGRAGGVDRARRGGAGGGGALPGGHAARVDLLVRRRPGRPRVPPARAGRRPAGLCRGSLRVWRFVVRARSPSAGSAKGWRWACRWMSGAAYRPCTRGINFYDRLIASYPAWHFHLELASALLEGGGHKSPARSCTRRRGDFRGCRSDRYPMQGDVAHQLPDPELVLSAPLGTTRCFGSIRRASSSIRERRWYPFSFDIRPGPPPGMEGYVVSWRYEIEAQRHVRA